MSEPQKRQPREWALFQHEYESEEDFRDAARMECMGLENMMFRLGRGFVCTPIRHRNEHGLYDTVGYAFSEEFMPAVEAAEQEAALEPEVVEA